MRRPPPWIALIPLAAAALVLGIGISEGVRNRDRAPEQVVWVDPAAVELDDFPDWADPRWRMEFDALRASWPVFRADDAGALAALHADLAALSFVREADRPTVDALGGLRLGFALRRPVAAIRGPEGFLTLDAEGVVLSGRWPAPPLYGDLFLPVILPDLEPPSLGDGADPEARASFAFDFAAPGDWLTEPAHLAALDTAISLAEHLGAEDRARLGRAAIDGSGFAVRGPDEPGVLIGLEDGRWIAFGRPPSSGAPGELPAARKWSAVGRALALARAGGEDSGWEIADVRWDVPELRFAADAHDVLAARLEPVWPERDPGFPTRWITDGSDPAPPSVPAQGASRRAPAANPGGARANRPRVR